MTPARSRPSTDARISSFQKLAFPDAPPHTAVIPTDLAMLGDAHDLKGYVISKVPFPRFFNLTVTKTATTHRLKDADNFACSVEPEFE
jgi:hypothetical protein